MILKVYCIRVLEITLDDGAFFYHQLETNEHFGPFPTVATMTSHMQLRMTDDIVEAIGRSYN
jgi:hypothetical protein